MKGPQVLLEVFCLWHNKLSSQHFILVILRERSDRRIWAKARPMKQYYVYIMTNNSRTLYTGVTHDLVRRVYEHRNKLIKGFTQKYNITALAYYEIISDVWAAMQSQKQIKGWLRKKKIALIEEANPKWQDLSKGWYGK